MSGAMLQSLILGVCLHGVCLHALSGLVDAQKNINRSGLKLNDKRHLLEFSSEDFDISKESDVPIESGGKEDSMSYWRANGEQDEDSGEPDDGQVDEVKSGRKSRHYWTATGDYVQLPAKALSAVTETRRQIGYHTASGEYRGLGLQNKEDKSGQEDGGQVDEVKSGRKSRHYWTASGDFVQLPAKALSDVKETRRQLGYHTASGEYRGLGLQKKEDESDHSSGHSSFDYGKPEEWGKNYPNCWGNRQSPIDLNSNKMARLDVPSSLNWQGYSNIPRNMTLMNNGHTGK